MAMQAYSVTLTGTQPFLMHSDNIEWADEMERWKNDPAHKKISRAGDDRSPAHRWIGCLYQDGGQVVLPADNLMRCLMEGGAQVPVPGGRSGKTFKAQTQSGMMSETPFWSFQVDGHPLPMSEILPLVDETDFEVHKRKAAELGFSLFIRRARIGTAKHVRVRPRFDRWSASGRLLVWDEQLTPAVVNDILTYAGRFKGLGDWRPGGRTPGPFGTFTAEIQPV